MAIINVENTSVTILKENNEDYISLTDMVKPIENGTALIEKWLRNKNTIEFLGIWEELYNPDFNSPEFEGIKNQAGLNRVDDTLKLQLMNSTSEIERKISSFRKQLKQN